MIKSMTGYGKATIEITGRKVTIEIKTLNSKQIDLNLKIPGYIREKEPEVRNILMQRLDRGKIDFYINTEITGEQVSYSINHSLALKYYQDLKRLKKDTRDHCDLLPLVMKMPDVMQTSRDEMTEEDWKIVKQGIEQAVEQTDKFRLEEGKILEDDMLKRVQTILQFLDAIEPFENQRIEDIRARLHNDFSRVTGDFNGSAPDQNRFEQELIYYLEKLDITEEKVRLLKHCQYFLETLSEPTSQGKKLGFVAQEMGREINTIGSKASHGEIQKMVIQMKDELEKVKEQLGNIL